LKARTIAGWVALISGGLLVVVAVAGSVLGASTGGSASTSPLNWMMGRGPDAGHNGAFGRGPGDMGSGMGGMMGFGSSGPASSAVPGAPEVKVEAKNFGFAPSEIRLPASTDVNLTLVNPKANAALHDLTVPVLGIHIVADAGETKTVGLRGLAAGRYDAYCSVTGHADLGMRAVLIVQ